MLASCAVEVKFHDWKTYECLGSIPSPQTKTKGYLDISWCNEGKRLVAVPLSGKSFVAATQQVKTSSKPNKDFIDVHGVKCGSFSKVENGNVVLGSATGEVLLYNVDDKRLVHKFSSLPACVNLVEFGAQDLFLAGACCSGQIFLYGSGHHVCASYCIPCGNQVRSIAVHPKITHLLSGGGDKGYVAVWDVNSGSNILKCKNSSAAIINMSFSTTDDSFTTISSDQKINIYDLRNSECVHEKKFDSDLTAIAYCPNGTDIAVATGRGLIICLDKRYLHNSKTAMKAHKYLIKKIAFNSCTAHPNITNTTYSKSSVDMKYYDDEPESLTTGRSSDMEIKSPASGDCSVCKSRVRFNSDKSSMATSRCNMLQNEKASFHIVDEFSLNQFREDIMRVSKEILDSVSETINDEFLKTRMEVSREFCVTEIRNKKRWHEFNAVLAKIADLDDAENPELVVTSIREPSLASQVRTKVSLTQGFHKNASTTKSVK